MVKQRSEELEIKKMVELGRENLKLYPKTKNWCKHLEIELLSSGLLAEQYKLPIGRIGIHCDYASGNGIQAMQLREVAASFIINNCVNCPSREIVDIDNIGSIIMQELERVQEQRKREATSLFTTKIRLKEFVSGDLTEALRKEEITAQSILELVALLDDNKHHIEAAKKLLKASEIASELFIDLAIEIICSNFPDPDHGKMCIDVIRIFGQKTNKLPEISYKAACQCLLNRENSDKASALIGDYVAQHAFVPNIEVINAIVALQLNPKTTTMFRSSGVDSNYSGSNHALKEIGKLNFDSIIGVIKQRLSSNNKNIRIHTTYVINSLIDAFPKLALEIIDPLISSLELDDDLYEVSADNEACKVLANIYIFHPSETQKKLDVGYQKASEEAKSIIFSIYREVAWNLGEIQTRIKKTYPLYEPCVNQVISVLVKTIGSSEYSCDVKNSAAEALDIVIYYHSRTLIKYIDTLLGILANLAYEEILTKNKTISTINDALENQNHLSKYGRIIHVVQEALRAICVNSPSEILKRLKEIIPTLSSSQPHLEAYKYYLINLYAQLGHIESFIPEIIPELYNLLMEFNSVSIRGKAVEIIGNILEEHRRDILPTNMLEILTLYLSDSYVYIHKAATRTIGQVTPSSIEEAINITRQLLLLDRTYQLNKNYDKDPAFSQQILHSLIQITKPYKELLLLFTIPTILKHTQNCDEYSAINALKSFKYLLPNLPEDHTSLFAGAVLDYIRRSNCDDEGVHSTRLHLLFKLYEFPKKAITDNLNKLRDAAITKCDTNPWEALRLTNLLTYFELYNEATNLIKDVIQTQPKTKRNEIFLLESTILMRLNQAEALLVEGKVDTVIEILNEIAPLEVQVSEDQKISNFQDFIDSFTLADKIADRLKQL